MNHIHSIHATHQVTRRWMRRSAVSYETTRLSVGVSELCLLSAILLPYTPPRFPPEHRDLCFICHICYATCTCCMYVKHAMRGFLSRACFAIILSGIAFLYHLRKASLYRIQLREKSVKCCLGHFFVRPPFEKHNPTYLLPDVGIAYIIFFFYKKILKLSIP